MFYRCVENSYNSMCTSVSRVLNEKRKTKKKRKKSNYKAKNKKPNKRNIKNMRVVSNTVIRITIELLLLKDKKKVIR